MRGEPYDAVIVGGGHNGLTAAAYLARAGLRTLVLERRHVLGGAAVTEEVAPGFRFSVCSYVVSLLRPAIIRELELARHGLRIVPLDGTFTPLPDRGAYLWRVDDHERTRAELRRWSPKDAAAYEPYLELMARIAAFAGPILDMVPPDPTRPGVTGVRDLASILRRFRGLRPSDRAALVGLLTLSAADFLDGWFTTDPLKATLAASGIIGAFAGIRTPGTAYVLLHHYMGELDGTFRAWGLPIGGTGAVSEAIAAAAREAGAEVRTEAPVARIETKAGRVVGVTLASGESIGAQRVLSSADPRATFRALLEPGQLPPTFEADLDRVRYRGASAKVNLALDALPDFRSLPGDGAHLRGAISISPSTAWLETAFAEARAGTFSRRPYIDLVIPTLADPTLAPPGKHVLSCFVQYAPYALRDGDSWDAARREALGDAVVDTLAEFAPNVRDAVVGRQVVTPLDLETEFGLTEGNIFQGELSLGQLFFNRPIPGWARYRTPIDGLWLCGSAAHPGGGIMGAPGRLAAREVLRTAGRTA